ncbi:hypothetical protein [Peptostreptococcus porci]|uniref:ATP-binding protein n=1 Tax=Peptostreptococcus porci TaxID=2652282 RepID=UPI002A91CD11|nr:hypothetical protein [Peptostreptococcus porci]MDY6232052.1 hypothetical protein [Peptostreptococcus porci]
MNLLKENDNEGVNRIPVIVAMGNVGALYITRTLMANDITVFGISHEEYLLTHLGSNGILVKDKEEWFDIIISLAKEYFDKNNGKKMVFLTDMDKIMDDILKNIEISEKYLQLPIGNSYVEYKKITDKQLLSKLNLSNISIPKTYTEKEQMKVDDFPVITKPLNALMKLTNSKALVSNSKDDLIENISLLGGFDNTITQEIISGETENLFCVTLYRNKYDRIIVANVVKKVREYPLTNGTGSCHVTVRNELVLEKAIELLRGTNYVGVAMIEFKYSNKHNDYFLIEVNGRFPIESEINNKIGNNFVLEVYEDILYPQPSNDLEVDLPDIPVYWILASYDIRACLKKKINFIKEYKKYKKSGKICFAIKNGSDKITYKSFVGYLIDKSIKRIINK